MKKRITTIRDRRARSATLRRRTSLAAASDESGVTLIEVMISIVILTVALLGLLGMGMVAMEGNQWANDSTRTTQLLQQKLEQLRASGNPNSGSEIVNDVNLSWTVARSGEYLRTVTVTATWKNSREELVSNSLGTLIKTDSL